MQPLAQAIPRVLAELLRGSPLSPGKVDFAWKAAVGPAMERVTRVRLEGHTLLVEAHTPHWTREIARSSRIILKRMQVLLGEDVIQEISIRA
jgi:hypothetical protein